jgi:RNA polymerase sigma-70 factor (ECF subfamily)
VFITYPYIRNFPWFEASDIVAETFLKAFKAGDKYDLHKGMLYPWLKGIANNVVKSYLRRCAPSVPIEDIAEPGRAAVSDCGPSEGVKKALDELTGEQSEIIQLRYYEGESIPNIAKRLKIKEGTARVRLHRAREAIRQQIEGSSSDLPKVL